MIAARTKVMHRISHADAFIVATEIEKRGEIVTGDRDFEDIYPDILWIR